MVVKRILAAAVIAAGLGAAAPAPASAAPGNCPVYVLCLYGTSGRVSQYSEYTSYFQAVSRTDVDYAWNRTPGSVYFKYENGAVTCALGDREARLRTVSAYGILKGVRITSSRNCF